MGPASYRRTPGGSSRTDAGPRMLTPPRRVHLLQETEGTETAAAATHRPGCQCAVGDHAACVAGARRCVTRAGRGRESHAPQPPSTRPDSHVTCECSN